MIILVLLYKVNNYFLDFKISKNFSQKNFEKVATTECLGGEQLRRAARFGGSATLRAAAESCSELWSSGNLGGMFF